MTSFRTVRLAQRPVGIPGPETWDISVEELPELQAGEFAVEIEQISLDPAMRGWLDDRPSYLPPVEIGAIMRAGSLGTVTESKNKRFPIGAHVVGNFGATEIAISDGTGARIFKPEVAPSSTFLGVLGMTGMTAYFGFFELGKPRAGDVVVVSAAAGAVGSIVGQLAKINGCTVIGIAGGKEKCDYVTANLGFDKCLDYKSDTSIRKQLGSALQELGAKGVDIYFDNVGGEILNANLAYLAFGARVVICGAISQYNATEITPGPSNYMNLLVKRASMKGFLVFDYESEFSVAQRRMGTWIAQGKITAPETIVESDITEFPATLNRLFAGDNLGKLILKIR